MLYYFSGRVQEPGNSLLFFVVHPEDDRSKSVFKLTQYHFTDSTAEMLNKIMGVNWGRMYLALIYQK